MIGRRAAAAGIATKLDELSLDDSSGS